MAKETESAAPGPAIREAFRRGATLAVPAATAAAVARVAIGVAALGWPAVPALPWVGASTDDLAARVLGCALGARDLALGLGTLAALRRPRPASAAAIWFAAAALSDALDTAITAAAWPELPSRTRWLVAASAGGAAVAGAAGAIALPREAALDGPRPALVAGQEAEAALSWSKSRC